MFALRAVCGLSLGLAIPTAAMMDPGLPLAALGPAVSTAVQLVSAQWRPPGSAEVVVAFDETGRVRSSAIRRSSGSERADAAALDAAVDLANLSPRGAVAGRTLTYRACFGA